MIPMMANANYLYKLNRNQRLDEFKIIWNLINHYGYISTEIFFSTHLDNT